MHELIILMNRNGHSTLIRLLFYCQSLHKPKDNFLNIIACQYYRYLLHADQYQGQFHCVWGDTTLIYDTNASCQKFKQIMDEKVDDSLVQGVWFPHMLHELE